VALDKQLEIAIRDAVDGKGQSNGISEKLIAWLESSINGESNPLEAGEYTPRLELIYSEMTLEEED